MLIIIAGCGKVGYTIAKNLSREKDVDIAIIDRDAAAFGKAAESVDAMLVRGNCLVAETLIEAGVKSADLIISVMNADETNILCCILAKRLGVRHTAARVRNPDYALELNKFWNDMGLDMIINPE
jgi:trk system potassium uptake protein TrkA